GVQIQQLTPALAENLGLKDSQGAIVGQVEKGAPADKAGIKAGDVVVAVDNLPVTGPASLRNRIGLVTPGDTVTLSVIRDGAKKEIKVKVETAPESTVASAAGSPRLEGASFEDSTDRNVPGVRVVDVEHNSAAWQAGLRPGDIIVAFNRTPVRSVAALQAELERAGNQVALFINRDGEEVLLVI
ncbi:MAG: PDZ domain-containing protein, partial [Rhodospirillaceae bacterium]